ncbi:MAG TPA: PAS domain-containing protein, partial [Candidatus Hydrogenedentes bacterium]|nr:PAS domain-containing protein [Candidatus Hydrogenedentota bacterium]
MPMKTVGWLSFKTIWLTVLLIASSLTLAVLGLITAEWRAQHAELELRADFQRQATEVASSINPLHVEALSFRGSDAGLPAFDRITEQFKAYSQESSIRRIYGLTLRGSTPVYGPCFFQDEDISAAPGSPYPFPSMQLVELLRSGSRTIETFEDDHITALAPIFDPKSDHVLMAVALDMPIENWQAQLLQVRLVPVAIALILLTLQFFGAGAIYLRSSLAPKRLRHLETVFAAIFGLLLTGIITYFVLEAEDRDRRLAFIQIAESKADAVENRLRTVQQQMNNIALFIENTPSLSANAFNAFTTPLINNTSVEACYWVAGLTADAREDIEERAREEGFDDFRVFRLDEEDRIVPVEDESGILYPVYFVEPYGASIFSPGFDLGSISEEKIALETAARTGLVTATIPELNKIIDASQNGLSVYMPVYDSNVSGMKALRGFVGASLRSDILLEEALASTVLDARLVYMQLFQLAANEATPIPLASGGEKSDNGQSIPYYFSLLKSADLALMHSMFTLSHTYALIIEPTTHFFAAHPTRNTYATAIVAFFITVVLTIFIGILRNQQSALESRIWESTIELRESGETFRRLFSESTDPILLLRQGRISDCNNSTLRLLKYNSKQQLIGKRPEDISPPKQPDGRPSPYAFKEMVGLCVRNGHHAFEWS